MSTTVSNSASHPHVFAHKHISCPPLSGFYCSSSRTTETPNGPTLLTPPQPRLLRDFYSLPHTVSWPCCLCKPLPATGLRDTCRASCALFRVYRLFASDFHLPFRCMTRSDTSGTSYSQRVQSVLFGFRPGFRPSLSTLITLDHIPTLLLASLKGTRKVERVQVELQT